MITKNLVLHLSLIFSISLVACKGTTSQQTTEHSQQADVEPPTIQVEQLTKGDAQHWSGYYDKFQVDPSGRYVLANEVDHFFRSPTVGDTLRIQLIDLQDNNSRRQIGTSTSWGWQQGCMLQWIPGSSEEVIWNDHGPDGFISKVYNIRTGTLRTLPRAIYTLSPDGKYALCIDFERLQFFRPGYGYPVKNSRSDWEKIPTDGGVYKMDLQTGESTLIVSYSQVAALERPQGSVRDYYHWFNHLLINPSGTRFILLNRSRPVPSSEEMSAYRKQHPEVKSHFLTRAITANMDGSGLYPLNDSGEFSHFIWKGDDAICAWAIPDDGDKAGFFVFQDESKNYEAVGAGIMTHNGHNTYVPGTNDEWILNDTYPLGEERLQELYLFHVPTQRKVSLGKFHEPKEFKGEWRCDLHPKTSQDGRFVIFDSTHGGDGRQLYKIDIGDLIE